MVVAGCFQRNGDADADVMLAVAACELACRVWGVSNTIGGYGDLDADAESIWPQGLLEDLVGVFALCNPVLSGRPLVQGRPASVGFPRVRLMNTLLCKAEACWRDTHSDTPWAPVDWKQILSRGDFAWRDSPCVSYGKGQEDHRS